MAQAVAFAAAQAAQKDTIDGVTSFVSFAAAQAAQKNNAANYA